ncbi:MAG: LysR family transcriptional regulator [Wenzhouxiangellaceae bacterium]
MAIEQGSCYPDWSQSIPTDNHNKYNYAHNIYANIALMNIKALQLFVEVAQQRSFTAVAKARNVDPSSVSRTIADLEDELGLRLLQRSTRHMTLTEAGERYLERIEPLLGEIIHATEMAQGVNAEPRGLLRLTASVTFGQTCLVPLLKPFRERYPALRLDCRFTDDNLDLVSERIDLAIRLAPAVNGDLVAAKLMDTRYRVVASPDYLQRHAMLRQPDDLQQHRVLLFNLSAYRRRWRFRDAHGQINEVPVSGDLTLAPASALLSAAIAGLGMALLPDWLIRSALASGRLVNVFPDYDVTATTFDTGAWLVYPSRSYLPNKVRVMIDFLREYLPPRMTASQTDSADNLEGAIT